MPRQELIEDVCAATAAHAFNLMPEIMALDPAEGFRRLYDLFFTAFTAYHDGKRGWLEMAVPSEN